MTDLFLDRSLAKEYTTRTAEEQRNFTGMVKYFNARLVRICKRRKDDCGTGGRRMAFLRMHPGTCGTGQLPNHRGTAPENSAGLDISRPVWYSYCVGRAVPPRMEMTGTHGTEAIR